MVRRAEDLLQANLTGIKGMQGIGRACNEVTVYRSMGERAIVNVEDHTGCCLTTIYLDFGYWTLDCSVSHPFYPLHPC